MAGGQHLGMILDKSLHHRMMYLHFSWTQKLSGSAQCDAEPYHTD